ncbi:MAG: ATP-binding cassette domain-containing protein [Gammaproteobacteria bacterium]|nr:MAG: ATP-binding cassette domain-containing protein [Gammaproteobacteria bacterium]
MSVIETSNLTKRFGKTLAVDDVSLKVERGHVYGILGPNGSGKTTTIGMIVGIIRPTSGTFRLFDGDTPQDLHEARRRIGGTLEQPNFYPFLTGRENLKIVAGIKGLGKREIETALAVVNMSDRAHKEFKTFSLGMKQRLALAAAMLGDPELLILDEPTNSLDPEGMVEIRELILKLAGLGKTIVLASHLLVEVERICSHVAIIKNGRLLKHGTVAEITRGDSSYSVHAGDLNSLQTAIENYPGTQHTHRHTDRIIVELKDNDPAALNRYLAQRGIYLSELSEQERSLEDAFMEVAFTGESNSRQGS